MIIAEISMTWPHAAGVCVGFICLASVLIGNWPWQRDIYHECDCDKHDEDED